MSQPTLPEIIVKPRPKGAEETRSRRVPPYHVILENDDHHSMEFVIQVLSKALGYTLDHSARLMLEAHRQGRSVVWTGPKEVAELKAEQIRTFHEFRSGGRDVGPLGCTIEPAPG